LAQPPDISDTFLREVDENLRRDRARNFAKRYGSWLIGGIILFLAAAGGWIYWQQRQLKESETKVEEIAQVYGNLGSGDLKGSAARLDSLVKDSDAAVRASSLMTRAVLAIEQNDMPLAIRKFGEVASDESLPEPYRQVALIRQTALQFDRLPPDQVITRLAALAKPGNPWFASAGELTAAALIKQGKSQQAGQLFATIAKDKSVPEPTRGRFVQLAASLGVDASGALGTLGQ